MKLKAYQLSDRTIAVCVRGKGKRQPDQEFFINLRADGTVNASQALDKKKKNG